MSPADHDYINVTTEYIRTPYSVVICLIRIRSYRHDRLYRIIPTPTTMYSGLDSVDTLRIIP